VKVTKDNIAEIAIKLIFFKKIEITTEDHFSVSVIPRTPRFATALQKVLLVQPVLGATVVVTVMDVQLL
jgi:hypothetical protein